MRPIFIIKLLLALCLAARAQSVPADSLLRYEYAIYKSGSDTLTQELLVKKTALYLRQNDLGKEALREMRRVKPSLIRDPAIRTSFLWNAAVVAYLNGETEYARHCILAYESAAQDSSVSFNLLALLINKYSDSAYVRTRMERLVKTDSLFASLDCFMQTAAYEKKHLKMYLLFSAIVPGSGTIMNGAVVKGALSLCLTAASVYGVVKLIEYGLYVNAFFWGTGVGLKFYTGNLNLTAATFHKAEQKQKNKLAEACELKLREVLGKYPIALKP